MGSWDVETSCGEEKHGDEIIGGAETTCLAFDGGEDAVEALPLGPRDGRRALVHRLGRRRRGDGAQSRADGGG